jgi:sulfate transport system substrate-binding protein
MKNILLHILILANVSLAATQATAQELLNASYDVSRELFSAINPKFEAEWQKDTGKAVKIQQSHAGSSAQAT